jgi:hypothetical protein
VTVVAAVTAAARGTRHGQSPQQSCGLPDGAFAFPSPLPSFD